MTKLELIIKNHCLKEGLDYKTALKIYNFTFKYIKARIWRSLSEYSFKEYKLIATIPYLGKFVSRNLDTEKKRKKTMVALYRVYAKNYKKRNKI